MYTYLYVHIYTCICVYIHSYDININKHTCKNIISIIFNKVLSVRWINFFKFVFILLSLIPSLMFFLTLCRFEFLTHITFLLSKELLSKFLAKQSYWKQVPSIFAFLIKSLFLLHIWRVILQDTEFCGFFLFLWTA